MPKVGGKNIEVLFSAETIAERNLKLAKAIFVFARNFENLLMISILKGSFIFAADLIRAMHDAGAEPDVEFITVSSYGKGTESTEVRLLRDIDSDVHGRDVLLIDDILIRKNAEIHPRTHAGTRRTQRSSRCCSTRASSARPISKPISKASNARIISWWDTAWTLAIPSQATALCGCCDGLEARW